MEDPSDRPAGLPFPASTLHTMLLKIGVPRLMADHTAALLAAVLRRRPKKDEPPDR